MDYICKSVKVPVADLVDPSSSGVQALLSQGYKPIATLYVEDMGQEMVMFVMYPENSGQTQMLQKILLNIRAGVAVLCAIASALVYIIAQNVNQ